MAEQIAAAGAPLEAILLVLKTCPVSGSKFLKIIGGSDDSHAGTVPQVVLRSWAAERRAG